MWFGVLARPAVQEERTMAGGLVGLLDDVAALAKLAAASVDDVGVAAAKASAKAAGVVIDDAAVTPAYVQGLAAERELPIIKKIATGSLKNKLIFILPVVLILSEFAPDVINIILMFGGGFLCYEGAHKIIHKLQGHADTDHGAPATMQGPDAEAKTISGAIRTDFILSAEIMVISSKALIEQQAEAAEGLAQGVTETGLVQQGFTLAAIAILITVVVYGAVALIVKMDDIGLAMTLRDDEASKKTGAALVAGMPLLLKWLTIIGTAAMLWVGGHIILAGTHGSPINWDGIYGPVHDFEGWLGGSPFLGGLFAWLGNTIASAILGFIVGAIIFFIISAIKGKGDAHGEDHGAAAH